jgi:hypothetical protein
VAGFCLSSTFVLGTAPPAVSIGQRLTCIIMRGYLKGQLGVLLVHSVLYMTVKKKSMIFGIIYRCLASYRVAILFQKVIRDISIFMAFAHQATNQMLSGV